MLSGVYGNKILKRRNENTSHRSRGFIGSHLSEALSKLNHKVIGVDGITNYYNPEQKKLNIKSISSAGVKFFVRDLATDNLLDLVSDAEIVFHLAAQPGISSIVPFSQYEKNNITATHKLLEAVKNNSSLKLFINVATSSIYGLYATGDENTLPKPASYYGVTKLAAEQLAFSYFYNQKLPVTSFRPFSVYGERERPEKLYPKLISSMLLDKEINIFEGSESHTRSYTYVGDVVQGLISSLDKIESCTGEVFNIGTDHAITTGQGIAIVEKLLNKKALIKFIPKRTGDQMETSANIKN